MHIIMEATWHMDSILQKDVASSFPFLSSPCKMVLESSLRSLVNVSIITKCYETIQAPWFKRCTQIYYKIFRKWKIYLLNYYYLNIYCCLWMLSKHLYQLNKEIVSNPIQCVFVFYTTFRCGPPNMSSSSSKVFPWSWLAKTPFSVFRKDYGNPPKRPSSIANCYHTT